MTGTLALLAVCGWVAYWQRAALRAAIDSKRPTWTRPVNPRHPRGPEDDDEWMESLR